MSALAPDGRLRAAINPGNAVLARRVADGSVSGVSVDIAAALAHELGVEVTHLVVDSARQAVEAVRHGQADIGFFAVDPERGQGIAFTPPYVLIEGCYLVANTSPIRDLAEVDDAGHRVVTATSSAYDLFLTRHLRHARIVRVPTSQEVVPQFIAQGCEVAAGVRQQLEADRQRLGGLRLLDGAFMTIGQAIGTSADKGVEAIDALSAFVDGLKRSGALADILRRNGAGAVTIAP